MLAPGQILSFFQVSQRVGGVPRRRMHPAWQGFTDEQAKPLVAYYVNGGSRNFEGFFRLLASAMDHQPAPADLPPADTGEHLRIVYCLSLF